MDAIELFAGGGGLVLGLHPAGFSPVAVVERDMFPHAIGVVRAVCPQAFIFENARGGGR